MRAAHTSGETLGMGLLGTGRAVTATITPAADQPSPAPSCTCGSPDASASAARAELPAEVSGMLECAEEAIIDRSLVSGARIPAHDNLCTLGAA